MNGGEQPESLRDDPSGGDGQLDEGRRYWKAAIAHLTPEKREAAWEFYLDRLESSAAADTLGGVMLLLEAHLAFFDDLPAKLGAAAQRIESALQPLNGANDASGSSSSRGVPGSKDGPSRSQGRRIPTLVTVGSPPRSGGSWRARAYLHTNTTGPAGRSASRLPSKTFCSLARPCSRSNRGVILLPIGRKGVSSSSGIRRGRKAPKREGPKFTCSRRSRKYGAIWNHFVNSPSAGSRAFVDTNSNNLLGVPVAQATAKTAALAGTSSVLDQYASQILDSINRDGVFVRVPAGKQFYVYVTQTLDVGKATIGNASVAKREAKAERAAAALGAPGRRGGGALGEIERLRTSLLNPRGSQEVAPSSAAPVTLPDETP